MISLTCRLSESSFLITDHDIEFYHSISPFFGGQIFQIPLPTLCPQERQRRRYAFRNERCLYKGMCAASGKQILSMYSPDKPYKVYDEKIRGSNYRNPLSYGIQIDYSLSFTDIFQELLLAVPHMSLSIEQYQGSGYNNYILNCKDCGFLYGGGDSSQIFYSVFAVSCVDCMDIYYCSHCKDCYECIYCDHCSCCFYSSNCIDCQDMIGCNNCTGCDHCIACDGLQDVSYAINNVPVDKHTYEQYINQDSIYMHYLPHTQISTHTINSLDCIGCNYIIDSRSLSYSSSVVNGSFCYDVDFMAPFGCKNSYELCTSTGTTNSLSTYLTRFCNYVYYCFECKNCEHCFGCVGLRDSSYCIFNKQYTKQDYEQEVKNIIGHMMTTGERGEFFHPSLSPFGYNETVAQEYFPLSKDIEGSENLDHTSEQCGTFGTFARYGYKRSSYESPNPLSDNVILGSDLPVTIQSVEDTIINYAIKCEVTGKLFRIQPQELAFYRKHNVPLPRRHPDQRHAERIAMRTKYPVS